MPLTPSQQEAVLSAHEPLFIQAGAGTGKTFTLTKRIAHGLSNASGPLIGDVNRMLTITFTNKAASELIGRIRAELRANGLDAAALQVDAAWISTIHAMCKRMLFSHAFDVGVDCGANMLTEEEAKALSSIALDKMLRDRAGDKRLDALIETLEVRPAIGLISMLSELLSVAPNCIDDFDFGPKPMPAQAKKRLIEDVLAVYTAKLAEIEDAGLPDKKSYLSNREKIADGIEYLETRLSVLAEPPSWKAISDCVAECPMPTGGNLQKTFKDAFNVCKMSLINAQAQALCAASREVLDMAVSLAIEHLERYQELKRFQGALDTNDLLTAAYRMLVENEQIAQEFREQFDSVMVDEFQDTDSLQVGIVQTLCDEGLSTLATVGDAQQSIYGFRGADLEVYREMRARMQTHDSKEVELTINYRSQPDILSFVKDIFSKQEFFGCEFLDVSSGRKADSNPAWLRDDEPKVKILFSAGYKKAEGREGTRVEDLRRADAVALADEFVRLNEQGAAYGDMAILLRSTKSTYSQAYLSELRKRGIPCVISGGSDFYTLPEVSTLVMLLRFMANRDDDEALFELLGSDLFNIRDDDYLALSIANRQMLKLAPDEARSKTSLFDALVHCVRTPFQEADQSMENALKVLEYVLSATRRTAFSQVVRDAVVMSGWEAGLKKRGVEGGATYANIERFCDMLDDYERLHGHVLFAASDYFRSMVAMAHDGTGARCKPGTLVSSGNEAVQVMTIHSSKGLEFPIVAVAEFEKARKRGASGVIALTENAKRYISFGGGGSDAAAKYISQEAPETETFAEATDALSFRVHASRLAKRRDDEEQQRLLYVALTRARDVLLLVAHDSSYASTGELATGLSGDCLHAVFGEDVPSENAIVTTPAGARVGFEMRHVLRDDKQTGHDEIKDGPPVVEHQFIAWSFPPRISARIATREAIYSYSSIARAAEQRNSPEPNAREITLRDRSLDTETASPVGSAFHLVAQWLAEVVLPDGKAVEQRITAACRRYELNERERMRLVEAVAAWVASSRFMQVQEYKRRYAEHAFCVDLEGIALEGFIDLLCLDEEGGALVIDYKTGKSGQREELTERYRLQAQCYAYALLVSETCNRVELAFVRPENAMQEVVFTYDARDVPDLKDAILDR